MAVKPITLFSQSSLQDYADCPRRFQLRYIDHLSYPAIESEPAIENEKRQREGEYFHRLAQQRLLGMDVASLARLANTPNLSRWWQNFIDTAPSLDGYTILTEYSLTVPLGQVRLVAKYDLLAFKDGQALIYDWKTSQRRPANEWLAARWQTRVYPALLSKSGSSLGEGTELIPENIQMIYWFPEFPSEPAVFNYNSAQFDRDWSALSSLADEILCAADFPQTDEEKKCGFCTYRSYCNRGVHAAGGLPDENETGGSGFFDIDFEQIGEIAF
jgi:hypothetical protein